jgi:hypothetical protein
MMHESPEALLLEGMRRLDEGDRAKGGGGGPPAKDSDGMWDGEGF